MKMDIPSERMTVSNTSNVLPLIRDPVTGAYSRELMQSLFRQEVERAQRYGVPLSVCFIDLDYFKSINDAYGHVRGDQVLRELTDRIYDLIRGTDLFFRYGGDEFLLLLPNTPSDQAPRVAQRILEKMREIPFVGDPPLTLSLSIGIASYPQDALSGEDLLKTADRRTSIAKRRGRGQVITHDETQPFGLLPEETDTRLIERERELETLQQFFKNLPEARRGILSVEGEAGTGRTRFLAQVSNIAHLLGYWVINLSDSRTLHSRPYGTLLMIQGLEHLSPPVDLKALEKRFETIIKNQSYSGILFVIDNLTVLDYSSFELLRQWIIFGTYPCQAIIYSTVPQYTRTLMNCDLPLKVTIELNPLGTEGLRIFLRNMLHWEPPIEFVNWLHKKTHGIPSIIQHTLKDLISQGKLQETSEKEWALDSTYTTAILKEYEKTIHHNLPALITEFIGRDTELQQANARLDRSRLLTIVGPGGIGKTRLALQIAMSRLAEFEDGIFEIPLATIVEPELVPATIAKILEIKEIGGKTILESLKEYLRDRQMLLVIDNFEQVISASPILNELLNTSPKLKLIVTSREVLRISGESIYQIPVLTEEAAVSLFVTRAQSIQYDFALTEENKISIAQLCKSLDGLPLAIELAAARTREFTIQEMLEQVNKLSFLSVGPRDVASRQQTLRGTMEWGYHLLSGDEQKLFIRLGIFIGGATLEAIESVCTIKENNNSNLRVRLQSLVDKSLIDKQDQRYVMLGTIREFALEKLKESGEETDLQQYHANYYLSLAEKAELELSGPRQKEWLDILEKEYPNLRTALIWAQKTGNKEIGQRLGVALGPFWEVRGYWQEGRSWLESFLKQGQPTDVEKQLNIRISRWLGQLIWLQGNREEPISLLKESLAQCRKHNDKLNMADILQVLGRMYIALQELGQATALLEESLVLYRELRNKLGIATVLRELGWVYTIVRGEHDKAWEMCQESLTLCKEEEDKKGIAQSYLRLGQIARYRGEYDQTVKLLEAQLAIAKELDDKDGISYAIINIAEFARSRQDYERANNLYNQYLEFCRKLGHKRGIAYTLNDLGEVARYQGDYKHASELYEESAQIARQSNDRGPLIWTLRSQGEVALYQKKYLKARKLYTETLDICQSQGGSSQLIIALCLEGLAGAAIGENQPIRAAKLLGAADLLFKACGGMLAMTDQADYQQRITTTRSLLDKTTFESTWEKGRALSMKQAISYALEPITKRTS